MTNSPPPYSPSLHRPPPPEEKRTSAPLPLPTLTVSSDAEAVAAAAAEQLVVWIAAAITRRGQCTVALAGGGTPRALYRRLATHEMAVRIDWARVQLYFGDERAVGPGDKDSNHRMVREVLLSQSAIPAANVHRIVGERGASEAAVVYREQIDAVLAAGGFDVVLLGMGSDGHTASLFGLTAAATAHGASVVVSRSPLPPHQRISLSLAAINASQNALLLVVGSHKADRLVEAYRQIEAQAQHGDRVAPTLPVAMVRPRMAWRWFVDIAAASALG